MKHAYVMISLTGTLLSRLVKLYTKEPYSHASLSLDKELHRMYSFGRVIAWNPFWAAHMHEIPCENVFKRFNKTEMMLLEFDLTDEQYDKLEEFVETFWAQRDHFHYSFLALFFAMFNFYPRLKNELYCSQYVGLALKYAGVDYWNKSYLAMRPRDFRTCPHCRVVYEGSLREYWNANCIDEEHGFVKY